MSARQRISVEEAYGLPQRKTVSVDGAYSVSPAPKRISVAEAYGTAPTEAMTIEVEGPDGVIIEFPGDTAPDVMKAAMAKRYGKPTGVPAATKISLDEAFDDRPTWDEHKAVGRQLAQGALFGFSDELIAAARLGWDKLAGGTATYDQLRQEERAALEAYAKENPKTAAALQLLGGVAMPGFGAAKLASTVAQATGRRSLAGASVGAGYGALQGAGEANEIGDVPLNTATHAGIGAAGGLALTKAADGAATAGRWVIDQGGNLVRHLTDAATKFVPSDRIAQGWARREAVEQMGRQGIDTARAFDNVTSDAIRNAPMLSPVAVDLGDRPTRLAAEALVNSDRGIDVARQLRQAQGPDAVPGTADFLDARFNIAPNERDTIRLNQAERAQAKADYEAYQPQIDAQVVTAPELLHAIETRPHARAAWEGGQINWANREGRLLTPEEIALQRRVPNSYIAGANGQLIPHMEPTEIPLGLVDDLLKASSQRMENLNKPGNLAVNGEGTYASGQAHNELVAAVRSIDRRHGTDLTGVRERYAQAQRPAEARELGMNAFSMPQADKLGEAIRRYDTLPPGEQHHFAVGYVDALRRAMTEAGESGYNVAQIFRSVEHRELFNRVMQQAGAGEQVREMMTAMMRRNSRNANFLAAAENRPIQSAGDQFAALAETASQAKLSPIAGARGALRSVLTPYTARRSDALVDLLMTPSGRDELRGAVVAAERSRANQTARRAGSDQVRDAMIQTLLGQHALFVD